MDASSDFSTIAHTNRDVSSLINDDLIDLYDSTADYASSSNRDLVGANNSQLLGESTIAKTKKKLTTLEPTTSTQSAKKQHQTVIREFKRFGTYCTLRLEQRRKNLVKVLPILRNSLLLQTILGENATTATAITKIATADKLQTTDIDSLLFDLDGFIIESNLIKFVNHKYNEQQQNFTSSNSFTPSCDSHSSRKTDATTSITSSCYNVPTDFLVEMSNCLIKIESNKFEEYLLELDAYLEEFDLDYVLIYAANRPTASLISLYNDNNTKSANHAMNFSKKTSKNHIDRLYNMDISTNNATSSSSPREQANHKLINMIEASDNSILSDTRSLYNEGASNKVCSL